MKVLVQIPCLNEEESIAAVIREIPKRIPGCETVDVLVIDDDSTDSTVNHAMSAGADIILMKSKRNGLANSFRLGQDFFLSRDYDVLVNTDGDNQYFQEKIPDLVKPIIEGKADIVIGDRKTANQYHFSLAKRIAQRLGSMVVGYVAGIQIADAASGFRAYSRASIAKIFLTTRFSYAVESIIQAGRKELRIAFVETGAREVTRPSRLFKSNLEHVTKSGAAIIKNLLMYRPLQVFTTISLISFSFGLIPMIRYLILLFAGEAGNHLQSLILGSLLITTAVISLVLGLVAELSRIHRMMFEEARTVSRLNNHIEEKVLLSIHSATVFCQKSLCD